MIRKAQDLLNLTRKADFLGPLALRLYLAHVLYLSIFLAGLDLGLQAERSARNKRSEVAFLGADWGGDAYPFPIIGFIPIGMFPYCLDELSLILNW